VTTNFVLFLIALALIPFAIPSLTPTWRWWLGVTCILGGLLAALWVQHWIVSSRPDYHEGAGGGIGLAIWTLITAGFAVGVAVRGFTLLLAAYGLPMRYTLTITLAGFAIVPGIMFAPGWWQSWKTRPASDECRKTTFRVTIADATFSIRATTFLNIYLGRRSSRDAYYLEQSSSLREFCDLSDNGIRPIKATNIWLRLRNYGMVTPALCAVSVADWAKTYCDAHTAAKHGGDDKVDFPLDMYVFAPNEVNLGDFDGSRSTHEDSRGAALRSGDIYVTSDETSRKEPLTFQCRSIESGYWCRAFYPWRNGAHLGYTFRSPREEIAARGSRIDAETHKFLSGLEQH